MKRLICLLVALGIVISTAGCVNPMLGLVSVLEENTVVSFFEDIERVFPPPKMLAPYFSSRQEVPLNNIPNADMENWTIKWDKVDEGGYGPGSSSVTYTGDWFQEKGTALAIRCTSGTPMTNYYYTVTASSPLFRLEHEYITFYLNGQLFSGLDTGGSSFYSSGNLAFGLYDSTNAVVTQKEISSISGSPNNLAIVPGYLTGTVIGGDGKSWKRVTVPLPASFVGKDVKLFFICRAYSTMRSGYPNPTIYGNVGYYIDNFYYSTSTGDEIYLLEAPTAQFTYVVNGYDVVVDANISQTSGTLYSLKWTWGDGAYSEGVTATHKYAFPGNKQITLKIMNNENLVDTATLTVSVDGTSYYAGPQGSNTTNLPPIAGFSYGLTGMTISVDGSYSKDDGTITLYSWDFDGVKKNGITVTHTYANSGSKTVTLIVKDNYGLESERKITFDLPIGGVTSDTTVVDNPGTPPTAKFAYTLTAPTVTVDASESSDDVKIEKYEWDWGDGSKSVGKTQSHTYSDMGTTRTITLTVTDNEGFTASSSATVQTISYNEPVDSNTTAYVAPPTTSGTSTPVAPSGGTTASDGFPLWGLTVFLGAVALLSAFILMATGKVKIKGAKRKVRRGKRK